jgi:excisionase family DNA binding protein
VTAEFLTVDQVAELAQLSPWTIRRAINAGELRAFTPRGHVRITRVDVDARLAGTATSTRSRRAAALHAPEAYVPRQGS